MPIAAQRLEGKFDSRTFMMQTLEAKVDEAVEQNAPENVHPSEWDLEEMLNALELIFPIKRERDASKTSRRRTAKRFGGMLRAKAQSRRTKPKRSEVTPEIMRVVEQRYLMLPIIDRQWVDHLYVMDPLKTGIGLRGYGQKDPRVEYEKEAYEIFESLKNNIADEAIKGVFRVVIEHGPPPRQLATHAVVRQSAVRADSVRRARSAAGRRAAATPDAARSRTAARPDARCRPPRATVAHEQRRRIPAKADAARPAESRPQRTVPLRKR